MGGRGQEPRNASGPGSEKGDSLSPGASCRNQLCQCLALGPVILTVGPTFGTVREQIRVVLQHWASGTSLQQPQESRTPIMLCIITSAHTQE